MSAVERYKGHDELIACWPGVLERVGGAQLVIAGRGDDVERLRKRAADAGVADRTLFTGFVSDATLRVLMRRAAVFAMPSRGEGFGLVYLQAMEAGLPCIGSTLDAAGDIILDGETGYLVDPADRGALTAALVRLLESPALRASLGSAGRRRYLGAFTYDRFVERFGSIVLSAFGPKRREGHPCAG
jgi:phosphatidyl-myo-inositol dimannoside synthase